MFIDIHIHTSMWKSCPSFGSWIETTYASPEEIINAYDEIGIERGVLLPCISPESSHAPQGNDEILAVAEKYPGRFIPFCNMDPRNGTNTPEYPLYKIMLHYKEKGCKGIGELTANLPFLDPKMQNLFRCAEIAEMPVTFHMSAFQHYRYGVFDEPGMPQLEATLKRFPKLKIFAHSQAFWAEMAPLRTVEDRLGYPKGLITKEGRVQELMRRYPNLYGDLSAGSGCNALTRDPEYAVKFLNEFQDRLFFGTDECNPTMTSIKPLALFLMGLLEKGEISQTVFNKVARENAIRVLGL